METFSGDTQALLNKRLVNQGHPEGRGLKNTFGNFVITAEKRWKVAVVPTNGVDMKGPVLG